MAMTINPAVSRVGYRRWGIQVGLFIVGVAVGAAATYGLARGLYLLLTSDGPSLGWLVIAVAVLIPAVLRDFGMQAPVPYRNGRQVPEWLRWMVPPEVSAFAYGSELGVGFLTNFTYSTHTAFVVLLATQGQITVVALAALAMGIGKSLVLFASVAGASETRFQERFQRRLATHGAESLRLGNAALAGVALFVLVVHTS